MPAIGTKARPKTSGEPRQPLATLLPPATLIADCKHWLKTLSRLDEHWLDEHWAGVEIFAPVGKPLTAKNAKGAQRTQRNARDPHLSKNLAAVNRELPQGLEARSIGGG